MNTTCTIEHSTQVSFRNFPPPIRMPTENVVQVHFSVLENKRVQKGQLRSKQDLETPYVLLPGVAVGWLDEWMVKTSGPAIAVGGEPDPARGHVCCRRRMLCFMSIGFLDSAISHEFSTLRDGNPSVFGAWTVVNKAAYAYLGLKKGIADVLPPVRDHLRLEVDGETIELPPSITTVQILNCHSSADGLDFWGTKESSLDTELQQFEPPHLADGLLEVVGTEGLVHMLSVRMRLRHSIRLAQGKSIRITMATKHPGVLSEHNSTATLAAQIDGESWVPTNGEVITLEHTQKLPVVFGWESLFNAGPCS
eukprot:m.1137018 g.1137018  ORF g.1137018 m.1137018 type:complete len:308 (-) comp24434_c2_seq2:374-1297(-)